MEYGRFTKNIRKSEIKIEEPTKFIIVFDNGKPYETKVVGLTALKTALKDFYIKNKEEDYHYDVYIYNEDNRCISEEQVIQELFAEIMEEVEGEG